SLTVRDTAALLDVTAGAGPGDPYAAPASARPLLREVGATRGALCLAVTSKAPNGVGVDAECLALLDSAAALCADLGHRVERVDPEIDGAAGVPTFLPLASAH